MSRKKLLESEVSLLHSIRRGLEVVYSKHKNVKIDNPTNGTVGFHLFHCIIHLNSILYDKSDL